MRGARVIWHPYLDTVVLMCREGSFALSPLPTMLGTLEDAVMFANRNRGWRLPSIEQARLVSRHLRKINAAFREHSLPQLDRRCLVWTDEYFHFTKLEFYQGVWCVQMRTGRMYERSADDRREFRLIYLLED